MDRKLEVMIDAEQIRARVAELAVLVRADLPPGTRITFVGVLKGAFIFLSDLIRATEGPLEVEFLGVSSYAGTESTGAVRISHDLKADIGGRDVVVVEDIVDTGLTLDYLLRALKARNPKSLRVVALLDKPSRRKVPVPVDLIGFSIPDAFVVGYGLDLDQEYRNLPYIGVFR